MKQEQFEREMFSKNDVVSVRAVELQKLIGEKERIKREKSRLEKEIGLLKMTTEYLRKRVDSLTIKQPFYVDLKV